MADMPLPQAITTLQVHPLDAIERWSGAAQVVLKAAEAGQDLGPYLQVLRQAYLESHQLPVMQPLARALTVHYLSRGDLEGYARLLESKDFRPYGIQALGEYPDLVAHLDARQLLQRVPPEVAWVGPWLKRHPQQLAVLAESVYAIPETRSRLPELVKDLVIYGVAEHVDLGAALPYLGQMVTEPGGESAAQALRWMAEAGVKMAPLRSAFGQSWLSDGPSEIARLGAYCLVYSAAREGDFEAVETSLRHPLVSVRLGATQALGVLLNSHKVTRSQVISKLRKGLGDSAGEVRQCTLRVVSWGDSSADPAPEGPVHTREQAEYLYWWMLGDKSRVRHVLSLNPGPDLTQGLQGQQRWACSICRHLPRSLQVSHESDLPPYLARLEPKQPFHQSGPRRCPECQTSYRLSYHEEQEDMMTLVDISVHRCPPDSLSASDLDHFVTYIRQDAAFWLCERALRRGDFDFALRLLAHPDDEVRRHAFLAVTEDHVDRLESGLLALLDDPQSDLRFNASHALFRNWGRRKRATDYARLLMGGKTEVVREGLSLLASQEGLDPEPLDIPIHTALKDPALRASATQALAWLALQRGNEGAESAIKELRGLTSDPDLEVRRQALKGLAVAFREGESSFQPAELETLKQALLKDPTTRFVALETLNQASGQCDIRDAYPALVQILLHDREGYADEAGLILIRCLEQRPTISPELVNNLAEGWALESESLRHLVSRCYSALLKAGNSIEPVDSAILKALLVAPASYVESYFARDYALHLVGRRQVPWEIVKALLLASPEVSGVVAEVLAEAAQKNGLQLTPVLAELVERLDDRHWFAGSGASKALQMLAAQRGPGVVEEALCALPGPHSAAYEQLQDGLKKLKSHWKER